MQTGAGEDELGRTGAVLAASQSDADDDADDDYQQDDDRQNAHDDADVRVAHAAAPPRPVQLQHGVVVIVGAGRVYLHQQLHALLAYSQSNSIQFISRYDLQYTM